MATASTPESHQQAHLQTSRTLFQGLLVGSVLLLLYSLWLRASQPDVNLGVPLILWGFVAVGVALGLWHFLALQRARTSSAVDELGRQRRLIGLIVGIAGVVLLLLGAFLAYQLKLQGVGESLGLWLFALFLLAAGHFYWRSVEISSTGVLDTLGAHYGLIRIVPLVVGILCLIAFVWLAIGTKLGSEYAPEWLALILEGMVCVIATIWLFALTEDRRTPANLRIFLLAMGGLTGLIITFEAAARAYVWRQDVLLGGISAWQGEMGYRFWICAYVGLLGLVVMFGSVLLARGDIRSNAQVRQILFGYNLLFTTLLLLAFLVIFNVTVYAMFPLTLEWTKTRGMVTLNTASKNLLKNLKQPTTVYVLLPQAHPIFNDMRAMLGNARAQSDKLDVKYVSPDRDFQLFEDLAAHFPEILPSARVARLDAASGRGVLIVYGELPRDLKTKVPHTFIPERKLFEDPNSFHQQSKSVKQTRIFKGEVEVMKELNYLINGQKQRKVYFVQGNGELDVNSTEIPDFRDLRADMTRMGGASLAERLKKDNYEVQGLSFDRAPAKEKATNIVYAAEGGADKRKEVPEDAWAVVIAGASKDFQRDALDALERYMDRGGRLLVTVDTVLDNSLTKLKTSTLEDFLKKYGVVVEDKFVMRAAQGRRGVLANPPLTSTSELAKQFWGELMPFKTVRVVRADAKAAKYKGDVLLQCEPKIEPVWEETNVRGLRDPRYVNELMVNRQLMDKLAEEPIPIAVTVSEDGTKPRLVVFGDTDFISNYDLSASGVRENYYALFVSSLEWMADRGGFIGPRPKETPSYVLPPSVQLNPLVILPGWFMALGIVGLGMGVWVVRRR